MPEPIPDIFPPAGVILHENEKFKIAQALYNVVTGKTEKASKAYSQNFKITKKDLDQLNSKLDQMAGQWTVLGKNTSIVIEHIDDNKELYSSYERMEIYDSSKTSPTESVVYEINLLLHIPGTDKPQPYKTTVRILSRLAAEKKMEENIPPAAFFRFFGAGSLVVEVEYVDYIIARTIISTIDTWVSEVEISKGSAIVAFLQKKSHWIPRIAELCLRMIAAYVLFMLAGTYVDSNPISLARYVVFSITFFWLTGQLAVYFADLAEQSIDRIIPLSYVKLNRGDERLLEKHQERKKWCIFKMSGGFILLLVQGIAINCFSDVLLKWLFQK